LGLLAHGPHTAPPGQKPTMPALLELLARPACFCTVHREAHGCCPLCLSYTRPSVTLAGMRVCSGSTIPSGSPATNAESDEFRAGRIFSRALADWERIACRAARRSSTRARETSPLPLTAVAVTIIPNSVRPAP